MGFKFLSEVSTKSRKIDRKWIDNKIKFLFPELELPRYIFRQINPDKKSENGQQNGSFDYLFQHKLHYLRRSSSFPISIIFGCFKNLQIKGSLFFFLNENSSSVITV